MNYDELLNNQIYKTSYPDQGIYIFRRNNRGHESFLNIHDDYNHFRSNTGDMSPDNGFEEYSIPTYEEIRHFEICEEMDEYVPFHQIDHNPLFIN